MPDIGEGLYLEKFISGWHVDDGGTIQVYAPLFTVSMDKIDVEVHSPATGIVEILTPCQSTVRAGDVAAIIHCAGYAS